MNDPKTFKEITDKRTYVLKDGRYVVKMYDVFAEDRMLFDDFNAIEWPRLEVTHVDDDAEIQFAESKLRPGQA